MWPHWALPIDTYGAEPAKPMEPGCKFPSLLPCVRDSDCGDALTCKYYDVDDSPLGVCAAVRSPGPDVPPGTVFCLQAEESVAARAAAEGYPLAPFYLVHVGDDGGVLLSHLQAKQILDRLKRSCFGRLERDPAAVAGLDRATQRGSDMRVAQKQLAAAVAAIVGRAEEKAVASLFRPGGTQGVKGEFSGTNDFEVVGYVVILPAEVAG